MNRRRKAERTEQYDGETYRRLCQIIAFNLRALRASRGFTQEKAAQTCGLSTISYVRVELGATNVTLLTLARIADGYEVSALMLLESMGAEGGSHGFAKNLAGAQPIDTVPAKEHP